ncbi:MAG: hypothetical protein J6S30_05400 [Kiritimatiellae bacterium]|nr:hypothetical protein [Kiritimatiellia bacterium]
MIVKMLHVDLLCLATFKDATLEALRELGAVHLDLDMAEGVEVTSLKGVAADAERAVRFVLKARGRKAVGELQIRSVEEILKLQEAVSVKVAALDELRRTIAKYAPYGDFDPALARSLLEKGIDISSVADLPAELPPKRLSAMREEALSYEADIAAMSNELASTDEKSVLSSFPEIVERLSFAAAREIMLEKGAVAIVSGWIPERSVDNLKSSAASHGWGLLLRAALPGEQPPVLVEPPGIFKPMKALFAGLGISPAYSESDVSVPFMCYFSLFCAMLVGDGAYGTIFLFGTLAMRRRLPRDWFILLTVFSSAAVLWGILSNTWFGAAIPALSSLPSAKWLADPSYRNMMLLCFTIGASHLMLARIWNGICKFPDSTAFAEFGWAGILLFMYLVTNSIVGIFSGMPPWGYAVFGVSLALVFLFSVKPSELKTRGAELGLLPLNIMSALGDIISYVRLFAVGLASMKVAENFNSMATGLLSGVEDFWLKAVMAILMVVILVVGHALNLAMAGLSILVHAVRLNTLEFSNHKGVTWSGAAYNPFKKKKEKNNE